MVEKSKAVIPKEAAQIMKRMVTMPPKPHDDMKLGKAKPRGGPTSSKKNNESKTQK